MRTRCLWTLLCASLIAAEAPAQRVTPEHLRTTGGLLPYDFMTWRGSTARYQQIVRGLGSPLLVAQVAFRAAADSPTSVARVLDLEVKIGLSSFALRSGTFAGNLPSPVQAIARKNVGWPAHTTPPVGGYPAPFDCVLAFDAPWVFVGQQDVCLEIVVYGNSAYPSLCVLDGAQEDNPVYAPMTYHGQGCVTTGRTKPFVCNQFLGASWQNQGYTLSYNGSEAPFGSKGLVLVGLQQLTLALPELCAPLQVFPHLVTLPATTSATAHGFVTGGIFLPYDPSAVGQRIFAQAAFVDPGQPFAVPAVLSAGVSSAVLPLPPAPGSMAFVYSDQLSALNGSLETSKGLIIEWK